MLQIELRGFLTTTLIDSWMMQGRHYRVRVVDGTHENEDGRIADDARVVCEMVVDFLSSLFYALLQFALFIGVLWLHSGPLTVVVGEAAMTVEGHMVYVALAYAVLAASVTVAIGHPLVHATDRRQAAEASFRESLVRAIGNSQGIALAGAEPGERHRLAGHFARVRGAWASQTSSFRNMIFISSGFGLLTAALPMLLLAPRHFAGDMSLGTLMQVTIAFGQVTAALCWLSDNYPLIAQWEASAERVLSLKEAVDDLGEGTATGRAGRLRHVWQHRAGITFRDFSVVSASGEALITRFEADIAPRERVLIEATPPAAAALFQAVAGLTMWGSGRIELPEGEAPFFMGERPYLPEATLSEILADPQAPSGLAPDTLARSLIAVGLTRLVPLLDIRQDWADQLDFEEQQRVGFARALVQQPRWIFMHDAATALDNAAEELLVGLLVTQLPAAALVTISHRPVASRLYQRRIELSGANPREAPPSPEAAASKS
jgi:putative ATP-binding cassette transporter